MKKLLSLLMALCLLLVVGCGGTQNKASESKAAVKVMKIGSVNPKERSLSKGFFKFKEIVEKETNGAIKVEVFTDGVLGDDRRTLEGIQLGSIQGTTATTGAISAFSPTIAVFDLPFLFKDTATAYKVLDGPIGQEMLDSLAEQKFIGLCYWENGIRHLTNSRREVTTLEDINGLKIRTLESPIHVDIWRSLGANPTPMSMSQLYTALEQKVVDGQENPLGNIQTNKFEEVQKYVTLTGHIYAASPFMVSKVFWDTLNDQEKAIIKKAALEARDYQRKLNAEEDVTATKYLISKGMKISELKPGEKEKMQEAVKSVYEKQKPILGEALVDKVIAATR